MKVFFRVDASIEIGSGHVMRCLSLASELRANNVECEFICRDHKGHMVDFIYGRGFKVYLLPPKNALFNGALTHSSWLGTTQEEDAEESIAVLINRNVSWLIVDHYGIDKLWHKKLRPYAKKIMVIDDLADRQHYCDFLLDQTYNRKVEKYDNLVPKNCELLCGSEYALLRKKFSEFRSQSLQRHQKNEKVEKLLISMGGVDKENFTGALLKELEKIEECEFAITVVLSIKAPHYKSVKKQISSSKIQVKLLSDISDMTHLMSISDIAIGAAGSSAWERCCLGLPAVIMVLAENQKLIAQSLIDAGAGIFYNFGSGPDLKECLKTLIKKRKTISKSAAKVCSGKGCTIIAKKLKQELYAD